LFAYLTRSDEAVHRAGRHDVNMQRSLKVIMSGVLVAAGIAGSIWCGVLLAQQGLDRAEKLVSIGVGVTSILIAFAGLWLGWLTWRRAPGVQPSARLVDAGGVGAVAVGGSSSGSITTNVSAALGIPPSSAPAGEGGVNASGMGAVAIGGDGTAPIRTRVTGPGTRIP
jgi:hypothetical protein